jgi:hypothetical protein
MLFATTCCVAHALDGQIAVDGIAGALAEVHVCVWSQSFAFEGVELS